MESHLIGLHVGVVAESLQTKVVDEPIGTKLLEVVLELFNSLLVVLQQPEDDCKLIAKQLAQFEVFFGVDKVLQNELETRVVVQRVDLMMGVSEQRDLLRSYRSFVLDPSHLDVFGLHV